MLQPSDKKRIYLRKGFISEDGSLRYVLSIDKRNYEIFFRSPGVNWYSGIEPILVLAMLPAMRTSQDLCAAQPIRPDLTANLSRFMAIFAKWYKDFREVEIISPRQIAPNPEPGTRIGAFFSGGIDSFYTLLKHADEITDLIYVHGFDVEMEDRSRRQAVSDMCRRVAAGFGKGLIEIETNARRLLKGYTHWGKHGHGTALASVGHVLSSEFRKIYIASSRFPDSMIVSCGTNPPWGSHPRTDPLLGDSTIQFVHDGVDVRRTEKLQAVCENQFAMDHLRVCWTNVEGTYNCGKCEKCMRTMISLYALGKLEECKTFPDAIDPLLIRRQLLAPGPELGSLRDNLLLLIDRGLEDSPVCQAVRDLAKRPEWLVRLRLAMQKRKRKLMPSRPG